MSYKRKKVPYDVYKRLKEVEKMFNQPEIKDDFSNNDAISSLKQALEAKDETIQSLKEQIDLLKSLINAQ